MNKYTNTKLKKFIDFYYQTNSPMIPSSTFITKELGITKSEFKTLVSYFISCGYIYKNGTNYSIFQTKRNFKKHTKIKEKKDYIVYSSPDYTISFNKFELTCLEPGFKIETLEDLIYMLFLFTIEFNVLIHPKIYLKNNEIWYKKECISYKDKNILFMCEFTQHTQEMNLINI